MKSGDRVRIVLPDPHFTLINTSRGGSPEVLVVNDALEDFAHREIFPWHLEVTIEAKELVDNGMPSRDEQVVLDELGDAIEAALSATTTSHGALNVLFLARSTWDGERQLLYRVHDPELAAPILERLVDGENARGWSYEMRQDAEWSDAKPLLELLKTASRKGN